MEEFSILKVIKIAKDIKEYFEFRNIAGISFVEPGSYQHILHIHSIDEFKIEFSDGSIDET